MSKKKGKKDLADQSEGFSNPFGDLLMAAGIDPGEVEHVEEPEPDVATLNQPGLPWHLLNGARVRTDRKGRRGKTVTILADIELSEKEGVILAKALGQRFGCRGFLEDGHLLLQGDHRQRIQSVLDEHGVTLKSVGG